MLDYWVSQPQVNSQNTYSVQHLKRNATNATKDADDLEPMRSLVKGSTNLLTTTGCSKLQLQHRYPMVMLFASQRIPSRSILSTRRAASLRGRRADGANSRRAALRT